MKCNNARDYPCGLENRLEDNYNCIIKLGKRVYNLEMCANARYEKEESLRDRVSELEKVVMECVVRIEAQDRAWEKAVRKLNGEPYANNDKPFKGKRTPTGNQEEAEEVSD